MPVRCAVFGCSLSRGKRTKALNIGFFNLPEKNLRKRRQWIAVISRKDWKPDKKGHVVCGRHFVSGRPSDNPDDIDYCPTKYMKGDNFAVPTDHSMKHNITNRRKRAAAREERACIRDTVEVTTTITTTTM